MNIGNKIKQLRQSMGITQEQLGTRLCVSAQAISKWENGTTMPDIALLPLISGELGVSIDELFDLTTDQKLQRIENRLDVEADFSDEVFHEYENTLKAELDSYDDKQRILSLLARLYHHRAESLLAKSGKYAMEAITLAPDVKDCQWLLQKSHGAVAWDWNCSNHTEVIDFYKSIVNDINRPQSLLAYYQLIDNLIADHRTAEATKYLEVCKALPRHKQFLTPVYEAYIALAEYDVPKADRIMESALAEFGRDPGFVFEKAQYHARKCEYTEAISHYELSWELEKDQKPRFTDALDGIATIYEIMGDKPKAIEACDRLIECLKDEWGYKDDDAAVIQARQRKNKLQ